jgi:hypothetical protein
MLFELTKILAWIERVGAEVVLVTHSLFRVWQAHLKIFKLVLRSASSVSRLSLS